MTKKTKMFDEHTVELVVRLNDVTAAIDDNGDLRVLVPARDMPDPSQIETYVEEAYPDYSEWETFQMVEKTLDFMGKEDRKRWFTKRMK